MSWITVIWSAVAGICVAMAGVHLLVWLWNRESRTNLAFALSAVGAAVTAVFELALMQSQTTAQYGQIVWWMHVPLFVLVISFIWFVGLYLQAGRAWLLWSLIAVRAIVLVVNLASEPNVTFQEITSLRFVSIWGDTFTAPVAVVSPWWYLTRFGDVLLLLFIADASYAAWKQRRGRQALTIGSVFFVAVGIALTWTVLSGKGTLPLPMNVTTPFLLIIVVMGADMSLDPLRVQKISRELSESQERMRLAASAANLSLWEWDIVRDEIWATEETRKRLGVGESERITFKRFLESVHPDDREPTHRAVNQALEGGEEFQAEYRRVTPEGAIRWVAASGQVLRGPNGKPLLLRGVSMDITERKQAESERIRLRNELAHIQRVSTMGQLSSALAHELNQPLGAILNNASAAQILSSKLDGENKELGEILGDIISDVTRASEVIRKIRGIVRKEEMKFGQLNLNLLIEEVVALYRNAFNIEEISSFLDLQPDLAPVRGDRVHLQQVLMNLINNASEAMKESSSKALKIRSTMQLPDMIIVSVSDSGTGIDEAKKGKVFEPFFTTKKDGLGMGLRICRSIIEEHGGRIWVENNRDAGATFSFSLKAHRGDSG